MVIQAGWQFTAQDWARIERSYTAWWAGELDRPLVTMRGRVPEAESAGESAGGGAVEAVGEMASAPHFVAHLPTEMPAGQVVDRYESQLARCRWYGDAFPKWWVNFGPGIMAGFLGARVLIDDHTVWFEPRDGDGDGEEAAGDLDDLRLRPDPHNFWWRRVCELTRVAAERWRGRACVGYSDLGGNLDILASLRGTQRLLMDLHDCPDRVARAAGRITRLWLEYFQELHRLSDRTGCGHSPWAPIWSPGRCYMLQSDLSYMVSPRMFERFVLPDLAACCRELDGAFYHLDGKGQLPHLDMLLELEGLHGIQWVPGDGPMPNPAHWPQVLSRILRAGRLCQIFTDARGALSVVREHGGKGLLLDIAGEMTAQQAAALLEQLEAEDSRPWEPW